MPSLSSADEHTARLHLRKTYQVLCEVLEVHPAAFRGMGSFLDLGCAPGGFASRLLEQSEAVQGYGVSIPVEQGGFPMLVRTQRLSVQACNLMSLASPKDLECQEDVDLCLGDAQDLGRRVKPGNQHNQTGPSRRGGKQQQQQQQGTSVAAVGVQAACTVLGIWALTFQQLMLGLGRLKMGGSFIFRFGWRGRGAGEEQWYRMATTRLLALIHSHFEETVPFKSEFSHQADACFYVVAKGFLKDAYTAAGLDDKLCRAIAATIACGHAQDLPGCLEDLEEYATPEVTRRIDEQLESIGRLRQIGLSSRRRIEEANGGKANPEAGLYISPVPFNLTLQRIQERLERFGKISYVKRRAHPVGVGADAVVQFAQPSHAAAALSAIVEFRVLGDNIAVMRLSDMKGKA